MGAEARDSGRRRGREEASRSGHWRHLFHGVFLWRRREGGRDVRLQPPGQLVPEGRLHVGAERLVCVLGEGSGREGGR